MTGARPPGDAPRPRSARASAALAAGITLVSFLLVAAWLQATDRRERFEGRRQDLAGLVAVRQEHTARLEAQLRDLHAQLARLGGARGEGEIARLERQRRQLEQAAGLTPLTGPGILVELADSDLARRGEPQSADFQIQDLDLQAVVNELWRAGAEAVAVNGQRIVATTAIRNAGGAVLVNYSVLASPYRIVALGDPAALKRIFEASRVAAQLRRWVEVYRLGFTVGEQDRLSVPAFGGALQFRYARAADGAVRR